MADGTARVGGARFDNLTLTLAEAERYTYTFDGRSQAIDHIIVNSLLGAVATYDVVHLNTGYNSTAPAPTPIRPCPTTIRACPPIDFRNFSELLNGTGGSDVDPRLRRRRHDLRPTAATTSWPAAAASTSCTAARATTPISSSDAGDVVIEAVGAGYDAVYTSVSYALAAGGGRVAVGERRLRHRGDHPHRQRVRQLRARQ